MKISDPAALVKTFAVRTPFDPTDDPQQFIWDGRTDSGGFASPGDYVIVLYFFDPAKSYNNIFFNTAEVEVAK